MSCDLAIECDLSRFRSTLRVEKGPSENRSERKAQSNLYTNNDKPGLNFDVLAERSCLKLE